MTGSQRDAVIRRFADLHMGFTLVDYENVGLPFFELRLDVLALERHELPVIDEFVLRLSKLGVGAVEDLAGLLGLERPLIETAAVSLLQRDLVDYVPAVAGRSVRLTPQGQAVLEERSQQLPERMELRIGYDRLLSRFSARWMADWDSPHTFKRSNARSIPSRLKRRPDPEDLDLSSLNDAIAELAAARHKDLNYEVLEILNVRTRSKLLPALMLVYVAEDMSAVRVSFIVDGHHSPEHDHAFAEIDGLARLGIDLEDRGALDRDRPELPSELAELRAGSKDAATVDEELRAANAALDSALAAAVVDEVAKNVVPRASTRDQLAAREREIVSLRKDIERLEHERASLVLRPIPTYEHRLLMEAALDAAEGRLLIISPWIRSGVVDDEFLDHLEQLCRNQVAIHIGYGITKDGAGHDKAAVDALVDLSARYRSLLVRELGYTHAKILLWDSQLVVTSFNWLSFRGDRSRKYRQEEGTLIAIPDYVQTEYERHKAAIESG